MEKIVKSRKDVPSQIDQRLKLWICQDQDFLRVDISGISRPRLIETLTGQDRLTNVAGQVFFVSDLLITEWLDDICWS